MMYRTFTILWKKVLRNKNKKNRSFYDEKKIIQQLFFSFSDYEINHVIIKPSGEFTIYYGDYNMCYILDSET